MTDIKAINLEGVVPSSGSIEFLRAEVPLWDRTPFALIRYALGGVEQDHGLRLDLGKQIFVDHFDDAEKERVLSEAVPIISGYLGSVLRQGSEGSIIIRRYGNRYGVSFASHWGSGASGIHYCGGDEELTAFLTQIGIQTELIEKALQDLHEEGHTLIPAVRLSREESNRYGL
jgi:hypothetical protein